MARIFTLNRFHQFRLAGGLIQRRRTMFRMIREALAGRYRPAPFTMALLVFTFAYLLFPFDLITDFIPVIGWIDDGLLTALLLKRLHAETSRFNRQKAVERKKTTGMPQ